MLRWGTICAWVATVLWLAPTLAPTQAMAATSSPVHHAATVSINPADGRVLVHDILTFEGKGQVHLNLSRLFDLESATLNGKAVQLKRDDTILQLNLATPGSQTLDIAYQAQAHPLIALDGGFLDIDWLAHPQDRLATWTVQIRTPAPHKAVLPGRLVDEQDDAKFYRATIRNDVPSTRPVLITGPYTIAEQMAGTVRIRTYFHEELAPLAETYLADTARYIGYYSQRVGPYPYPGFSIISGTAEVGWGLPGMTYMGRRVLALPFIRYTSLPHEVLHNWWGNAVEVDYDTGNWAEGLTTYQADHAMAAAAKDGGGAEKRLEWLRNYSALPPERDVPLTQFRSKTHDATQVIGYGKTAFVFHMLKTHLGERTFTQALQRFNRDNHLKTAGWDDIQAAFEAQTKTSMDGFFDAWVNRPGAPNLMLSAVHKTLDGVGFTLRQAQKGKPYPLFVPVRVDTQDGAEVFTVDFHTAEQAFELTTHGHPVAVHVDPNFDVFRHLDAALTPPILRDITLDTNAAVIPFGDGDMRETGFALARELLQTRLRLLDEQDARALIIIGTPSRIQDYLDRHRIPNPPDDLRTRGDARAWTMRTGSEQTILFVEAEDTAGLTALARVLPHYKRRSYVVMENSETIDKGTWPAAEGPLTVHLD